MAIALDDPVFLFLVVALLVVVFVVYLLVRRTVLGFREGYEDTSKRR